MILQLAGLQHAPVTPERTHTRVGTAAHSVALRRQRIFQLLQREARRPVITFCLAIVTTTSGRSRASLAQGTGFGRRRLPGFVVAFARILVAAGLRLADLSFELFKLYSSTISHP